MDIEPRDNKASVSNDQTSVFKLLAALAFISALFVSIPVVLLWQGYKITVWDFATMALPVVGILITTAFDEMVSEDFQFHTMGTEMCGLALGACISILSIQLSADESILSGITTSAERSRLLFFALFLINILFLLITTRIAKAVATKEEQGRFGTALLKLLNFVIGAIMLGIYTLTLIVGD
jgi:hypothetical protein